MLGPAFSNRIEDLLEKFLLWGSVAGTVLIALSLVCTCLRDQFLCLADKIFWAVGAAATALLAIDLKREKTDLDYIHPLGSGVIRHFLMFLF